MQLIYTGAASSKRRVRFVLVSSSDGVTLQTGVTISSGDLKVSKNGAAYSNATGTWTEISDGEYYYEFAASEIDTTGEVVVRYSKTGTKTVRRICQVVAFDPVDSVRLGMTALPNAAAEAAGGLFTRGTGAGQINQDSNGRIDINIKAVVGSTTRATNLDNMLNPSVGFTNTNTYFSANVISLGDALSLLTTSPIVDVLRNFFDENNGVDLSWSTIGGITSLFVKLPVDSFTANTITFNNALAPSIVADSIFLNKPFSVISASNPEAAAQSGVITAFDYTTLTATIKCNESSGGNFVHTPVGPGTVVVNLMPNSILAPLPHPVATIPTLASTLSTITSDTTTLKSDTTTLKSDTTTLKSDTTTLKSDTTTLKSDTTTLKSDTTTLKSDTTTLKSDTSILKSDTSTLKSDTTTLKSDTTTLKSDTTTLKSDTTTLKADNVSILDAIDNISGGGGGGGGDPLSNPVPGSYAAGTAGHAIGAIKAKTDTLGSLVVQHINPVLTNLDVFIVQGDDYKAADGRSLDFSIRSGWPSLSGATNIRLKIQGQSTVTGSLVGTTTLRFEMTSSETAAIPEGTYLYEVSFTNSNSNVVTLIQASLYVRKQLT